ncbi:MAG: hypothetical protein LBG68_04175 [Coriobacteriales bacterium]|jgi:peptidoglycan hydrolase CwlO-like protein|nr:hypothetical protein [Coriobacteriales bacterium]
MVIGVDNEQALQTKQSQIRVAQTRLDGLEGELKKLEQTIDELERLSALAKNLRATFDYAASHACQQSLGLEQYKLIAKSAEGAASQMYALFASDSRRTVTYKADYAIDLILAEVNSVWSAIESLQSQISSARRSIDTLWGEYNTISRSI